MTEQMGPLSSNEENALAQAQNDLRDEIAIAIFANQVRALAVESILIDREFSPLNIFIRAQERREAGRMLEKIDAEAQLLFRQHYKVLADGISCPKGALKAFRALTRHAAEKMGHIEGEAEAAALVLMDSLLAARCYQMTAGMRNHHKLQKIIKTLFEEGLPEVRHSYIEARQRSEAENLFPAPDAPNLANRDGFFAARRQMAEMMADAKPAALQKPFSAAELAAIPSAG